MLRDQIKKDIAEAITKLKTPNSKLEVEISRTQDAKFGDYATNVALKISHVSKQSPLETAKILARSLKDLPYVSKLEVAGPGFINFFIKPQVWQEEIKKILKAGDKFGSTDLGKGKKADHR